MTNENRNLVLNDCQLFLAAHKIPHVTPKIPPYGLAGWIVIDGSECERVAGMLAEANFPELYVRKCGMGTASIEIKHEYEKE
jgi:hypothetical protein